ncbi:hypothetical protein BO83DRAFT_377909 [Aspergillus eucalypticola CBS 122712]|uniref:Uncharacterized protein n=1 Tax=Aspergillus eucalypticola (strain CBS 122712 / IBT 29274) TaxID=1448314 RepID=A0A317VKK5_ASPEC|nr:uncharacterized protein BO83DRAFT_377909 [Aspergillus eucalypticola CBS 122712]PWY74863.1 hypothetical protein BO83DRAFT_377909 [Aspergillus eucalypticola CBS 122712]
MDYPMLVPPKRWVDPHLHLPSPLSINERTTSKSLAHLSTCLSSRLLPAHRTGRITAPWRGTNAINPDQQAAHQPLSIGDLVVRE